ncbi:MAG: DUF4192 family protein [Nocardioidaceae bacterium]
MSSSFAPDPASPTEPMVLRARATDELIAVVPALLGFHPQHSLVAIAVHGPRHRLGLRLRLDLPPVEHATAVAREVTEHLRRQRPDGVLLVAFAEHPTDADAVVEATIEQIDLVGLEASRTPFAVTAGGTGPTSARTTTAVRPTGRRTTREATCCWQRRCSGAWRCFRTARRSRAGTTRSTGRRPSGWRS